MDDQFHILKTIWTDSAPWNLAPTAALRVLNARMMPRNLTQHGTTSGSALAQKRHRSAQKYEPGSDQHSAYTHKLVAKKRTTTLVVEKFQEAEFSGVGNVGMSQGGAPGWWTNANLQGSTKMK